ncbi:MAG: PAS domain-containing protein [Clostridia bacterium]|nr:PAS domain-containing protein [Clostridia bacterium]
MKDILNVYFIVLNLSFILTLVLFISTARRKNKTQLHIIFLFNIAALLIWELGQMLEVYWRVIFGYTEYVFVYFYFLGVCFLPPFLLFLGIIYYKRSIKLKPRHLWAFAPSTFSYLMLLTSKWHGLFLNNYSTDNALMEVGKFFWVHNAITYIYILTGLVFIVYTSFRSSGFFSKQSLLILTGMLFPFAINILNSYKIVLKMPVYMTSVAFSITIIFLMFSILRYDFLNVMPIALSNVFDQMTDGVIILDENLKIIDFNAAARSMFSLGGMELKRNLMLSDILKEPVLSHKEASLFFRGIRNVVENNKRFSLEKSITTEEKTIHLSVEVSNVTVKGTYYSTVILIKDVTELRNQMEELQRSQEILMEKERLASLGNLIGGIAHNLKTPIMTISGVSKTLEALGEEYRDSIDDPEVTPDDHREIAAEIIEWTNKIAPYCSYMSEMISAVKGQAVQLATADATVFTLYELLSRINILMKFELKKFHCELRQETKTSIYNEMKGDLSILVQVFNNIITNAIQSYQGKEGVIDFKISSGNGRILFVISDQGIGIPENIQKKLFKEMVTTKGRDGTGLGMYMAHSTIRGHFNGRLSFESQVGKGTTFYIEIPIYKEVSDEKK